MRKLLFILPLLTLTVFAAATRFQYFETWSTKLSNQDLTISPSGTGVLSISSDTTMTSTGAIKVPVGTEAQRPTGAAGKLRFNSDTSGFEGHDGSTWGPIGGGGGGGTLKIFHQQEFETTVSASDFTCGTNLTAADETTDEIAGDTSLSITQGATPPTVGIECVSPTITLEKGQIDKFFGVDFYTTWTGNDNEMDFVVYDQGNNELVRVPIKASTVPLLHSGYGETLSTSTSIRYEIEVAVQNASDELIIDDIEFKVDPLTPTDLYASSDWEDCGMTASDFSAAFGSVTAIEDICKRDGTDLIINVKFVAGTVTGGAATITPRYNGSTITIDSIVGSNIPSGTHQRDASIVANSGVVLISGGDTFLEFAPTSSTGAGPYTARPADEICTTGANCGFEARVPIAGWRDTAQGVVVKNVESKDIANTNEFSATILGNGSVEKENLSGWIKSVSNPSAGTYDITFADGLFSTPPIVHPISIGRSGVGTYVWANTVPTTSGIRILTSNNGYGPAGTLGNIAFGIQAIRQGDDFVKESEKVYTVPVDSLTGNYVRAEGNGGTSITAGTTDIDFIEVADSANAWDGTTYTVQKNNSVVDLKFTILTTTSADRAYDLYKNGTLYARISDRITNTGHTGSYKSSKGEFVAGDSLSIRSVVNGGTLSNSAPDHYLNITEEYGDRGIFLGTAPTDFVTAKYVASDVTSNGDIAALTFTGLEVNKWYEVTGNFSCSVVNSNTCALYGYSGASASGTLYGKSSLVNINTAVISSDIGISYKFKAVSTTLYMYAIANANATIRGDGTVNDTFIQLTELNSTR